MIAALLSHLWQSTLFAGAAWVVAVALRRNRAHLRYSVWFLASVKFLVPFSLLVGLGEFVPWRAAAPPFAGWVAVTEQVRPLITIDAVGAGVTVAARAANWNFERTALAVWFCGFAGIAICWAARWRRVAALRRAAARSTIGRGSDSAVPILSTSGLIEPGVFGIVRPVLLLPAGIEQRLTASQLDAVLAHEFCHVRRRDNLTAAVHTLVQAIFWFHPLLWWLGARLVEERERACDEEVLRLGNPAKAYAEGILTVCKLYVESPRECMAGVTGANLKRRIEAIMRRRIARELGTGGKALLAAAGLAAVALPLAVGVLNGAAPREQSEKAAAPAAATSSLPAFEVASIKPSDPNGRLQVDFAPGGRLVISHATLRFLIKIAYDVGDDQITGGPAWLGDKRFDIQAKPDRQVPGDPAKMTRDQLLLFHQPTRLRLQRLLGERFHLELRKESKPLPIFALTIARSGVKMKRSVSAGDPVLKSNAGGVLEATRVEMQGLARFLSEGQTGRPVVDATGLKGGFDFRLEWTPDPTLNPADPNPQPPADASGLSIFTALQQELGLKLEARTGAADSLAVTRAEPPSGN